MDNKVKQYELECGCGCGSTKFNIFPEDGDFDFVTVSYFLDAWYSDSLWDIIRDRIIMMWKIATGKRYHFYDVIIDKEDWVEFVTNAYNDLDK